MTLAEQVAAVEAESNQLKAEIDRLRAQVSRQEGAIREGRSERSDLLNKLEKLTSMNAYLTQHFHTIHGSSEHIASEAKQLAGMYQSPVVEVPKKLGLLDRLYQPKEKPNAHTLIDNPGKDTGSVRVENGQSG